LRNIKRRRTVRFSFVASISVVNLESEKEISGRTGDLNMFGCYVTTSTPFPHGTRVIVRISHGARAFAGAGTVRFTRSHLGMGIAFTACETGKQTILDEWLAHLGLASHGSNECRAGAQSPSAAPLRCAGERCVKGRRALLAQEFTANALYDTIRRSTIRRVLVRSEGFDGRVSRCRAPYRAHTAVPDAMAPQRTRPAVASVTRPVSPPLQSAAWVACV
jgi:PilZ domain